jgi:hypothetical protein
MVKDPGRVIKLEGDIKAGTRKQTSHIAKKIPLAQDHKTKESTPKPTPKKEK